MVMFNERLKQLREESKYSQSEFAEQLKLYSRRNKGFSKSSINMYERGEREPGLEALEIIADYFNVDMDYLFGRSDYRNKLAWLDDLNSGEIPVVPTNVVTMNANGKRRLPRIGRIACGGPILAVENIEDYDCVPEKWKADFTLLCVGDSMAPKILDGDLVAIRRQPIVDNGQIAAVIIDKEATLKRVRIYPDHMMLLPENPEFQPIILTEDEMNSTLIAGRVVGICRDIN